MPLTIKNHTFEPAFVLAPMEDVTDQAFRLICKELGADIVYTEFVSSEALIRNAQKSHRKLLFQPAEHPVGIQLYGSRTDSILSAARIALQVSPDFIDLNVGCPVSKVADQGMGAGLLKNCDLLQEIVSVLLRHMPIPVTVKMRIGWDDQSINVLQNVEMLNRLGIHWIAIHARTRSQGYKGEARWEWIKKAKEISRVPIIGNGDIDSVEKAEWALHYSGVDGLMIGRAAIRRPWIFRQLKAWFFEGKTLPEPEYEEKVFLAQKHFRLMVETRGDYAVSAFRRFSQTYFSEIRNVARIRQALNLSRTVEEVLDILENPFKLM